MNIHLNEAAAWSVIVVAVASAITFAVIHYDKFKAEIAIEAVKAGLVQKRSDGYSEPLWVEKGTK